VEEVGAGAIRQCCATVKRYSGLREVANGAGDGAISPPVYARGSGRLDKLGDRFHPRAVTSTGSGTAFVAVGTAWSLGQASCGCLLSDLFSLSALASAYAVAELVETRATIGRSLRQVSCSPAGSVTDSPRAALRQAQGPRRRRFPVVPEGFLNLVRAVAEPASCGQPVKARRCQPAGRFDRLNDRVRCGRGLVVVPTGFLRFPTGSATIPWLPGQRGH